MPSPINSHPPLPLPPPPQKSPHRSPFARLSIPLAHFVSFPLFPFIKDDFLPRACVRACLCACVCVCVCVCLQDASAAKDAAMAYWEQVLAPPESHDP